MKKLFSIFLILTLLSLSGGSALAQDPTAEPTVEPTAEPTQEATAEPTAEPTQEPTVEPTAEPTQEPTVEPTAEPTQEPTVEPTAEPTQEPTVEPTTEPTQEPTVEPTQEATATITPTATITATPTATVTVEVSAGEIDTQALTSIQFTSRVGIMDTSGTGATFSLAYYNASTTSGGGGGARGSNNGLSVGGFKMTIVNQATDTNISAGSLKGSAVLQSNSPLAAAVFVGGTGSGGYNQFEAYDSGGFFSPGTKFFIPNVNRQVGSGKINSEIAIQNAETTPTNVNILFVTQGLNKSFTIAPNATLYYTPQNDTAVTNNAQQPVVVTSLGGKQILVVNNNFRTIAPVNLSDTPGFKQSDAAATQFLSNVQSKLSNGSSVITFIQNVSAAAVTVKATFVKDPTCTTPACNNNPTITRNNITIQPNEVVAINPRTDASFPANWFGSAKIETVPASNSIIAFGNQVNTLNPNAGGYAARAATNTTSTVFCPYVISGLPNYNPSSQASTMLIQNVGTSSTNVTVQFIAGVGSPTNFNTTKPAVALASGARLSFNFRLNDASQNGGVPANWFGSVRITASGGGKVAAVTNLFNKMQKGSDTLGSYNCISPQ